MDWVMGTRQASKSGYQLNVDNFAESMGFKYALLKTISQNNHMN